MARTFPCRISLRAGGHREHQHVFYRGGQQGRVRAEGV